MTSRRHSSRRMEFYTFPQVSCDSSELCQPYSSAYMPALYRGVRRGRGVGGPNAPLPTEQAACSPVALAGIYSVRGFQHSPEGCLLRLVFGRSECLLVRTGVYGWGEGGVKVPRAAAGHDPDGGCLLTCARSVSSGGMCPRTRHKSCVSRVGVEWPMKPRFRLGCRHLRAGCCDAIGLPVPLPCSPLPGRCF